MNLIPENNLERILSGEDVTPNNRTEYFVKQAMDNAGPGGDPITVDSELSDTSENPVQNKVITAALEAAKPLIVTATLDTDTMEISDASASLEQVLQAAAAERRVEFQLRATAEIEGVTVSAFDTFTDSSIKVYSNGTGEAVFSAVSLDDGTPLLCRIVAASGDHDGNWVYDETELATVTP